jgi:hypothetical protein
VQLPHTTSPYSKMGLINAKYIRIREYLSNKCKEAGRIITGLRCNSSRQKLFRELGWEILENRRNKHKLILFNKILNGLTPAYLYESPYSKMGLINAKCIRIREYLSNKCLTCLSKNKREHAFL